MGGKSIEGQIGAPSIWRQKSFSSHPGTVSPPTVTCPWSRRMRAANSASWRDTHRHTHTNRDTQKMERWTQRVDKERPTDTKYRKSDKKQDRRG